MVPDTETIAEPEDALEDLSGPPTIEQPIVVETPAGKEKKGKEGKEKKGKGKKDKGAEVLPDGPSIAGHPRAVRSVARAKSWGALLGFVLGGYLSLPTHTLADAGLRALIAGAALYVGAWAVAVFVWRRLVIIEIKAREQQLITVAEAGRAAQLGAGEPAGPRGRQGTS